MSTSLILIIVIIAVALAFDFTNGFNDSANIVATSIMARAIEPQTALLIAAVSEFTGAYFLGTAVASTIGKGIIDPSAFVGAGMTGGYAILSAIVGAIAWNFTSWRLGVPSSSSHALIGGLVGSFCASRGFHSVHWEKVGQVVAIMIISPMVGFTATYIFTKLTLIFSSWCTPSVNKIFRRIQVLSLITQSLAHGTNDAQKTMGVITFSLMVLGFIATPGGDISGHFDIPRWVTFICAFAIALGMGIGGKRIIKTLGSKLYKIRPVHGFASQIASTIIIYTASTFGFPLSTTQVITSSVMGSGAAFRLKMVRWQVAQNMVFAWFITIPSSALVSMAVFFLIKKIF